MDQRHVPRSIFVWRVNKKGRAPYGALPFALGCEKRFYHDVFAVMFSATVREEMLFTF